MTLSLGQVAAFFISLILQCRW